MWVYLARSLLLICLEIHFSFITIFFFNLIVRSFSKLSLCQKFFLFLLTLPSSKEQHLTVAILRTTSALSVIHSHLLLNLVVGTIFCIKIWRVMVGSIWGKRGSWFDFLLKIDNLLIVGVTLGIIFRATLSKCLIASLSRNLRKFFLIFLSFARLINLNPRFYIIWLSSCHKLSFSLVLIDRFNWCNSRLQTF